MIRKFFFSEELGRNIIWIMLSGFFLKIGAKENIFGQIILPKDHYLFNLDQKELNSDHIKYRNLHYFFLDGSKEYLNDSRFKKIKKKINIYYVGNLKKFWDKVTNSQPLFSNDLNSLENNIKKIKKKYPVFFFKYYLKIFFTTIANGKNLMLFLNHLIGKKKFVYYGYIKPTSTDLKFFEKKIGINKFNYEILFEKTVNKNQLKSKIDFICNIKEQLKLKINDCDYPYLNEFILFMIRNLLCSLFRDNKNFMIHDGLGGDMNFNAYEMFFGNQHIYLDLGSKVGYDKIYPRYALLKLFNRTTVNFSLDEKFFYEDQNNSFEYLNHAIKVFLEKLNFKF